MNGTIGATLEIRYRGPLDPLVELLAEARASGLLLGRLMSLTEDEWSSLSVQVRADADLTEGLAALSALHRSALSALGQPPDRE